MNSAPVHLQRFYNRIEVLLTFTQWDEGSLRNVLMAKVQCSCTPGTVFNVRVRSLKQGYTESCGCIRRESLAKRNRARKAA